MSFYKYLCEFAVKYRPHAAFFCEDDKHAVNIGEPDVPLATLLRNKKVMISREHQSEAADHDWHRFKLIPSVLHNVTILQSINDSFYGGSVTVTLKDAILQKSTPLRHQVEKEIEVAQEWKPIDLTYSDHNRQKLSVKIALTAHHLKADLDMSISVVTYPGGSYVNPAERAMPLLNIAMQGVSLSREKMQPEHEAALKSANCMEYIRKACKDNHDLTKSTMKSVQSCIDLLNERFVAVHIHGTPLRVGEVAASDKQKARSQAFF